jgi:hypothetical protein
VLQAIPARDHTLDNLGDGLMLVWPLCSGSGFLVGSGHVPKNIERFLFAYNLEVV